MNEGSDFVINRVLRTSTLQAHERASEIAEIAINQPQTRHQVLKPWFMTKSESHSSLAPNTCYCQAVCKQLYLDTRP
ncbi:hypothetical protein ARMSODRAFT_961196 [Armillaria solidipes]|uniref:Uncharacterized protein n=1 Tax=Armillaria solidipes TaxID=1076256 RepID=A0A2H3B3S1_9AGAR|nr:hypothetical protein ARMSODRAFT_961196 [Armillaria solidipes]